MTTTSPIQSVGRYELDPKAGIYLINFDTVNGLELYTRMTANHWASLNPDPGSQWNDIHRVSIGDGFLFWFNENGITNLGVAQNTPVFSQPRGHRCGYWDVSMGKSWRTLDKVVTFPEMDNLMLNRISAHGIIQWTILELTHFGHAEAHQVFSLAMSRT
jgi:hypothetical protein